MAQRDQILGVYCAFSHADMPRAVEGAEARGFRPLLRNPKYWRGETEAFHAVIVLSEAPNAPEIEAAYSAAGAQVLTLDDLASTPPAAPEPEVEAPAPPRRKPGRPRKTPPAVEG